MSGMRPWVFPRELLVSVMCPQQAGIVQPQYSDSTYCSNRGADTNFTFLFLMWYTYYLELISQLFYRSSKNRPGQDLFCLPRQLTDKEWDRG